jgi:sulfide:quinone oxidoreductase
MNIKKMTEQFSVTEQLSPDDVASVAAAGFRTIICNRPDAEEGQQYPLDMIENAANANGIDVLYVPVVHDTICSADVREFTKAWTSAAKPVLAYCRSGLRSCTLWSLMQISNGASSNTVIEEASKAGFDFTGFKEKFAPVIAEISGWSGSAPTLSESTTEVKTMDYKETQYDVLIVGAGASGISVASSLLNRERRLRIALIDPAETHYYQPGFTMIGGGVFDTEEVKRPMASLIPKGVKWIPLAVESFEPEGNAVVLNDGSRVSYKRLIACPGIKLNWDAIEGLSETLGRNGVTSNYRADLAPYTWKLINGMTSGKAVFTQPPMPIKCAGAPQKALYLAGDHWYRHSLINNVDISFYNAGAVLFGVKDYVPALQSYMDKYKADVHFSHKLIKVDGEKKLAWFETTDADGNVKTVETAFDMLHVCPPQTAPDFIRNSPLADDAGWIDVDPGTLQHKKFANIWGLGDAANTTNAKTAAAVRKQVPVVAANIVADIKGQPQQYHYDGYGSCPLTVERGKIVLAEFAYGGKLMPTLPVWMLDGTKPTSMAWHMKKSMLPALYWHGMLKGHELLVKPVAG